jgi:DNA-binding ferritin-like protein
MEHTTKIDIGIDAAKREEIAAGRSRILADTHTLCLKTHNVPLERHGADLPDPAPHRMQVHEKTAWMPRSLLE